MGCILLEESFYLSDFWSNESSSYKLWWEGELLSPCPALHKMHLKASYATSICLQKHRVSSNFKGLVP